jgi:hypothetical protein
VPLVYDKAMDTWQVALHDIPNNRTHHYMIVVDGTPTYDKTCDGLAIPQGPQEARWQVDTPAGPRVMMLFAQAK